MCVPEVQLDLRGGDRTHSHRRKHTHTHTWTAHTWRKHAHTNTDRTMKMNMTLKCQYNLNLVNEMWRTSKVYIKIYFKHNPSLHPLMGIPWGRPFSYHICCSRKTPSLSRKIKLWHYPPTNQCGPSVCLQQGTENLLIMGPASQEYFYKYLPWKSIWKTNVMLCYVCNLHLYVNYVML